MWYPPATKVTRRRSGGAPVRQKCRCSCDSQRRLWQCKCHTSPPNLSEKVRAQFANFFGGVLFVFHMKNDDEEFSDDLKNSPKTFLDSPEKNPSFPTSHTNQPHRHQPISNPLQPPSGCHHWVPAIASHLQLPKHPSPGPESARNARERT